MPRKRNVEIRNPCIIHLPTNNREKSVFSLQSVSSAKLSDVVVLCVSLLILSMINCGEPRALGDWFRRNLWQCYDAIKLSSIEGETHKKIKLTSNFFFTSYAGTDPLSSCDIDLRLHLKLLLAFGFCDIVSQFAQICVFFSLPVWWLYVFCVG